MKTGRNMLMLLVMAGMFLGSIFSSANEQQVVLIGHPGISETLTQDEVQQIFLGRKTRWRDDRKIDFLLYNHEPVIDMFLRQYVKKTPFQYKNFWKKQVFTGKGRMPKAYKDFERVLNFVASTEGAVSFAFRDEVAGNDTVRIIPIQE